MLTGLFGVVGRRALRIMQLRTQLPPQEYIGLFPMGLVGDFLMLLRLCTVAGLLACLPKFKFSRES